MLVIRKYPRQLKLRILSSLPGQNQFPSCLNWILMSEYSCFLCSPENQVLMRFNMDEKISMNSESVFDRIRKKQNCV